MVAKFRFYLDFDGEIDMIIKSLSSIIFLLLV